jgi:hypothetical protein
MDRHAPDTCMARRVHGTCTIRRSHGIGSSFRRSVQAEYVRRSRSDTVRGDRNRPSGSGTGLDGIAGKASAQSCNNPATDTPRPDIHNGSGTAIYGSADTGAALPGNAGGVRRRTSTASSIHMSRNTADT